MRQAIAGAVIGLVTAFAAVGAQKPTTRTPPKVTRPPSVPPVTARAAPALPVDGAKIYSATCTACHQTTGRGLPNQFPPLAGSDWVTGSEDRLIRIILHGVIGEIEVEGEMFTGAMPTWGPTFKDDELAAVASYVRRSWGNKAPAISTATVTRVRLQYASRTKPWTAAELRKQ